MPRKTTKSAHERINQAANKGELLMIRVPDNRLAPKIREHDVLYLVKLGSGKAGIRDARHGRVYFIREVRDQEPARYHLGVLRGRVGRDEQRAIVGVHADAKMPTVSVKYDAVDWVYECVAVSRPLEGFEEMYNFGLKPGGICKIVNEESGTLPERSVAKVGAQSDRKANGATAAV